LIQSIDFETNTKCRYSLLFSVFYQSVHTQSNGKNENKHVMCNTTWQGGCFL